MGTQTIVHGRIQLDGNFEAATAFIKTLDNDGIYPAITKDMFTPGNPHKPYHLAEPVIGFAAIYKGLEYDWASFIIKFENVLRNIKFITAKIQLETEYLGTYDFFWKSKDGISNDSHFIETKEWYFGFGPRSLWGTLDEEELKDEYIFSVDFQYPIVFEEKALARFNEFLRNIADIGYNEKVYLSDYIKGFLDNIYPILIYLVVNREIKLGAESGKGYFIEKLKDIAVVTDANPR